MNALDFLKNLEGRGVALTRHGQKLIVDAPTGALAVADRNLLSQLKPELLAILEASAAPNNLLLDWKGTQKALEKISQPLGEANQPTEKPRLAIRKPWSLTAEEEAAICRVIEKDQRLPPGSLRLFGSKAIERI